MFVHILAPVKPKMAVATRAERNVIDAGRIRGQCRETQHKTQKMGESRQQI